MIPSTAFNTEATLNGRNELPEGECGSKFFPLRVAPILEAIHSSLLRAP